jgi:hypothetical protein
MDDDEVPPVIEVGKRYFVMLTDCCIVGSFTATVIGYEENLITFDNGVELNTWDQVRFEYA